MLMLKQHENMPLIQESKWTLKWETQVWHQWGKTTMGLTPIDHDRVKWWMKCMSSK